MIQLNPPITQPDFNRRMTKLSKSESTFVVEIPLFKVFMVFKMKCLKSRNKLSYLKLFLTQLVCVIYKNWNINVNKRRNSSRSAGESLLSLQNLTSNISV